MTLAPSLTGNVRIRTCKPWTVTLYIGGCVTTAKAVLARQAAEKGACWSVEPTEFIYSGGRESGIIVRRIAYARFPSTAEEAETDMLALGELLMREMGQGSFSVVGPVNSIFVSRRSID